MAGALIIVLREAVEAGLIIGIVLAVTRGMPSRTRYFASGRSRRGDHACLAQYLGGAARPSDERRHACPVSLWSHHFER